MVLLCVKGVPPRLLWSERLGQVMQMHGRYLLLRGILFLTLLFTFTFLCLAGIVN